MDWNNLVKTTYVFFEWIVGLLTSYNVWGTIIGALIGGVIAMKIAKQQVTSSIKLQEKQRISISKHERELSVLRMRIDECREAMLTLNELKSAISNYGEGMEELRLCVKEGKHRGREVLLAQSTMARETSNILDVITKTRVSIEICGMPEETRCKTEEFSAVLSKMFDWGMQLNMEKFLEGNEIISELVMGVHDEFNQKVQELIKSLESKLV